MIDPKEDELSGFAHWYLSSGVGMNVHTPMHNKPFFIGV
jgi:hypothetical protein